MLCVLAFFLILIGIVAGDIKNLSAASLLKNFWEYEGQFGTISKGMGANLSKFFLLVLN